MSTTMDHILPNEKDGQNGDHTVEELADGISAFPAVESIDESSGSDIHSSNKSNNVGSPETEINANANAGLENNNTTMPSINIATLQKSKSLPPLFNPPITSIKVVSHDDAIKGFVFETPENSPDPNSDRLLFFSFLKSLTKDVSYKQSYNSKEKSELRRQQSESDRLADMFSLLQGERSDFLHTNPDYSFLNKLMALFDNPILIKNSKVPASILKNVQKTLTITEKWTDEQFADPGHSDSIMDFILPLFQPYITSDNSTFNSACAIEIDSLLLLYPKLYLSPSFRILLKKLPLCLPDPLPTYSKQLFQPMPTGGKIIPKVTPFTRNLISDHIVKDDVSLAKTQEPSQNEPNPDSTVESAPVVFPWPSETQPANGASSEQLPLLIDPETIQQNIQYLAGTASEILQGTMYFRKILSFAAHPPIDIVVESGVIPFLLDNLTAQYSDHITVETLWVLTNISSGSQENTQSVVDAGCVAPMINLFYSSHPEIVSQAIWALGNIAGDSKCKKFALHEGLIPAVIYLYQTSVNGNENEWFNDEILGHLVWLTSNILRGAVDPITTSSLVDLVTEIVILFSDICANIGNSHPTYLIDLLWSFNYISSHDQYLNLVLPKLVPILPLIFQFCDPLRPASVYMPSLRFIGNLLASEATVTQMAIDGGCIPFLESFFPHWDSLSKPSMAQKEIFWCFSNIAAGSSEQGILLIPNALKFVCKSIMKPTLPPVVLREGLWVVSNISLYPELLDLAMSMDEYLSSILCVINAYPNEIYQPPLQDCIACINSKYPGSINIIDQGDIELFA